MKNKMTWTKEGYGWARGRWTISNGHISFDIHPLFDGSGRKAEYPDGIIVSPQQSTKYAEMIVAALNSYTPDTGLGK